MQNTRVSNHVRCYLFFQKLTILLHGYSQSNHHLIHLADIHISDLIYFQVCNMLKILHNKNQLKQFSLHCRMLHWLFHMTINI